MTYEELLALDNAKFEGTCECETCMKEKAQAADTVDTEETVQAS